MKDSPVGPMRQRIKKIRGPVDGDRLFERGNVDYLAGKPLGVMSGLDMWGIYAMGYRFAVDILVDRLRQSGMARAEKNFLLYPIAFCARHHLELALKEILLLATEYDTGPSDLRKDIKGGSCKTPCGMGVPPLKHGQDARAPLAVDGFCKSLKGHALTPFWDKCLPHILRVWPNGPEKNLTVVRKLLREFERHDLWSFAFRYPVDLKGQKNLELLDSCDLLKFHGVFLRLSNLLSGISQGLSGTSAVQE